MAKQIDVITCARTYLGTPLQQQARVKGKGIDCIGITLCVGDELGLHDRAGVRILRGDHMNYGNFPIEDEMQRITSERLCTRDPDGWRNPRKIIRPGDVLTIAPNRFVPDQIHHMAIVSELPGGFGIIHGYATIGVVAEHLLDVGWYRRIAGIFYYPEVVD